MRGNALSSGRAATVVTLRREPVMRPVHLPSARAPPFRLSIVHFCAVQYAPDGHKSPEKAVLYCSQRQNMPQRGARSLVATFAGKHRRGR